MELARLSSVPTPRQLLVSKPVFKGKASPRALLPPQSYSFLFLLLLLFPFLFLQPTPTNYPTAFLKRTRGRVLSSTSTASFPSTLCSMADDAALGGTTGSFHSDSNATDARVPYVTAALNRERLAALGLHGIRPSVIARVVLALEQQPHHLVALGLVAPGIFEAVRWKFREVPIGAPLTSVATSSVTTTTATATVPTANGAGATSQPPASAAAAAITSTVPATASVTTPRPADAVVTIPTATAAVAASLPPPPPAYTPAAAIPQSVADIPVATFAQELATIPVPAAGAGTGAGGGAGAGAGADAVSHNGTVEEPLDASIIEMVSNMPLPGAPPAAPPTAPPVPSQSAGGVAAQQAQEETEALDRAIALALAQDERDDAGARGGGSGVTTLLPTSVIGTVPVDRSFLSRDQRNARRKAARTARRQARRAANRHRAQGSYSAAAGAAPTSSDFPSNGGAHGSAAAAAAALTASTGLALVRASSATSSTAPARGQAFTMELAQLRAMGLTTTGTDGAIAQALLAQHNGDVDAVVTALLSRT